MGLFSLLSVGTKSLMASQIGMDLAGQNISNADVDGYSRKRMNMTANYRPDPKFGQMGFGVEVINIERQRSAFIDDQIRRQNSQMGRFEEIDYSLQTIENVFTEPSDTGLRNYMDNFFDAWQNLANNPADLSARTMVSSTAQILTSAFHNVSSEMSQLRQTRNDEISARMGRINELAQEISNFNNEIGAVEIGNQHANDSRDGRDRALKELSEIIEIETIENKQGQITVTTGGSILVSPVNVNKLEGTTTTTTLPDGTSLSTVGMRFSQSKQTYNPTGGQLLGLIESRDTVIPKYQSDLDTLAMALTTKVNDVHERGFNLNGYTGVSFFDPQATGASDFELSATILSSVQNISTASGGAPVAFNEGILAPALDFGAAAYNLTNRNIQQNTVVLTATTITGPVVLQEGIDYHIDYVNGSVQMLHNGYDGLNMNISYQYGSGSYMGPGDNSTAIAVAGLRDTLTMNPDVLGNEVSTFTDFYSAFVGDMGLARNEAAANLETRKSLISQYETHQDSIAGVSLDEEMADLMKFQHTYQAAARLISITNEMLDALLRM